MADMLSQEEIDALLNGTDMDEGSGIEIERFTADEIDAIGEIGNINMGTAATTLFTLLGQKVTITTPKVSVTTLRDISENFIDPCVLIHINYKLGIQGTNLLVLNEKDVKIITDLMMGGEGTNVADELTDLHLSAINEAMNQMIGSSSTSMSEMLGTKIDITPPEAYYDKIKQLDFSVFDLDLDEDVVRVAFNIKVGDLIDSEIMQIIPIDVAKQLISKLMTTSDSNELDEILEQESAAIAQPQPQAERQPQPQAQTPQAPPRTPQVQQTPPQPQQRAQPMQQQMPAQEPVNAKKLEFESFDENPSQVYYNNDIGIIRDVPLEITVELGRTSKRIEDILDFGVGTVVELDKLVGEALDILANGKRIAKGEVVVVDENYGIRITDIVVPEKIIDSI